VLDDAKFRAAFELEPTSWDDAVAETLSWAKAKWGTRAERAA
jgi:hypothetical protein